MKLLGLILAVFLTACAAKKPVISFGSPEETFATWREAVERLDTEVLIQCYVESAKPAMRDEIKSSSREGLAAMQRETEQTKFLIEKIVYEGPKAYLRITRSLNGAQDIEVINMILEQGAWKIVP